MINNNVLNGFSILNNVIGDFKINYAYNQFLKMMNNIVNNTEDIEESFLNKYNYDEKYINNCFHRNYDMEYVSSTNNIIDKFISFQPVIYRFSNANTYRAKRIFCDRLYRLISLNGIYGVILKYTNKNDFINVTHPLVLFNLLYSNCNFIDFFEYALIYPIDSNDEVMKEELSIYDEDICKEYKSKIIEIIDGQITQAMIEQEKVKSKSKDTEYTIGLIKDEIINYHSDDEDISKNKIHKFIIPCNIICENHFIPQYIWLFLKLNREGLYGKELISNSLICTNLNHSYNDIKYENKLVRVCNGGDSPYTYRGLLNMLKQNVASQYSSRGFSKGFYTFVKANIEASKIILERFINEQDRLCNW